MIRLRFEREKKPRFHPRVTSLAIPNYKYFIPAPDNGRFLTIAQDQQEAAPPITQELQRLLQLLGRQILVLALGGEVAKLPARCGEAYQVQHHSVSGILVLNGQTLA